MPGILNQRAFLPIPAIIIIGAILLGGAAVATGVIKLGPAKNLKPAPSINSQTENSLESYKNDQYGYSLQHPKGWVVKDQSDVDKREVLVVQPANLANALIAARKDNSLKDKASMEKAINARQEFLKSVQSLTMDNFKSQVEDKKGAWMMVGEKTIEGKKWAVLEKGLLDIYGKVLLEQSGYALEEGKEFKDVVTQVLNSFKIE